MRSRSRRKIPRRWKLGRYFLGPQTYDVFLLRDTGSASGQTAGAWKIAGRVEVGWVEIGMKCGWSGVVENVMHEAMELSFQQLRVRYDNDIAITSDSGACIFVLNHVQFGEAIARASDFFCQFEGDLYKQWLRMNPKKKRSR